MDRYKHVPALDLCWIKAIADRGVPERTQELSGIDDDSELS